MPDPAVEGILEDAITRHMRTEFASLRIGQTTDEALRSIRANPPASRVLYFYVVDGEGRVQGVVPTRRLLLAPLEAPIEEIMVGNVITLPGTATVAEACEFFMLHRLLAFPVVDAQRRILGVVDIELYTSELQDLDSKQRSDDLFQLIGVHLTESRQPSPWAAFRGRFPWLLANVGGGVLAALLAGIFRAELEKAVALSLFIPVVLALSESISIQSLSLALQRLRGRRPTLRVIAAGAWAEMITGFFLGTASAAILGLVGMLWIGEIRVVLALVGGILGGATCAALIGMATPSLLRLFRREPQVAAGPLALAATDFATLLIYFRLARWLLA